MLQEFKKFAMRGNVIDLAVGVIIGGAFGKITDSLVKDILMPPLGLLIGRVDFSQLYIVLAGNGKHYASLARARAAGQTVLAYGDFINAIIQFVLLAFAVFLLVRFINNLHKPENIEDKVPDTRPCPYCLSAISDKATRCPHCTSEIEPQAAPSPATATAG
jgi:large conductance mechanosensitive channel